MPQRDFPEAGWVTIPPATCSSVRDSDNERLINYSAQYSVDESIRVRKRTKRTAILFEEPLPLSTKTANVNELN